MSAIKCTRRIFKIVPDRVFIYATSELSSVARGTLYHSVVFNDDVDVIISNNLEREEPAN